jgi:hypothetical protein
MIEEPVGFRMHDLIGVENILSEVDYPHTDTSYPDTQAVFEGLLKDVPDDKAQLVTHGNAEHLFNWTVSG